MTDFQANITPGQMADALNNLQNTVDNIGLDTIKYLQAKLTNESSDSVSVGTQLETLGLELAELGGLEFEVDDTGNVTGKDANLVNGLMDGSIEPQALSYIVEKIQANMDQMSAQGAKAAKETIEQYKKILGTLTR